MVRDWSYVVLACCLLAVLVVAGPASPVRASSDDASFRAFLTSFDSGLNRLVNGDPSRWNQLVSRSREASMLGGSGGYALGEQAAGRYAHAASQFDDSGAAVQVEYLSTVVAGDLAYTVSIERSQVKVRGRAVPLALRVTHVFRREDGAWKLLHRHADPGVSPSGT